MHPFDPVTAPLEGETLVEASAGTGKTYAIVSLYLRMIVEREEITPPSLLVVTFTRAATAELKNRIRERLTQARDLLAGTGSPPPDDFLPRLMESPSWPGNEPALARLERALSLFDLASLFTIHGFCERVLCEHPFESALPFDRRLEADRETILAGIVDDFRRTILLAEGSPYVPLMKGLKRDELSRLLESCSTPFLTLDTPIPPDGIDGVRSRCRERFSRLREIWRERGEKLTEFFRSDPRLNRRTYNASAVEKMLAGLDALLSGDSPYRPVERGELAGWQKLSTSLKKGAELPDDPFHTLWDAYREDALLIPLTLRLQLLRFARERLDGIRRRLGIRFFDDLLEDLHAALVREGSSLGEILRTRYRAVLIDEFQDTDTLQCRIFQRAFGDGTTPLFFIGDPKQSIYAFRGADLHAYLAQRERVPRERRATLTVNRRSTPPLLDALNQIFLFDPDRPFLFGGLAYHQVSPPPAVPEKTPDQITLDGFDPAPLQLWYVTRQEGETARGDALSRVADAVVGEIVRLLEGGKQGRVSLTVKGERLPLSGSHVAVVVRNNEEGRVIQQRLAERGVASVRKSDQPVFSTPGARDLLTVMEGIATPLFPPAVRRALSTLLMGWDAGRIAATLTPEAEGSWDGILLLFRELHDLWREQGFMVAFRRLMQRERLLPRLLSLTGGERMVTDILHCAELIHRQEQGAGRGVESLLSWFAGQVADPRKGDEFVLRLESDDDRVRILTIHGSKGLEFPVVFAPFLWGGVSRKKLQGLPVVVHEEGGLVADMGTEKVDGRRTRARDELLAEEIRLAYVAMTRAQLRLYVTWGDLPGSGSSPLAWLFHRPKGNLPSVGICDHLEEEMMKKSPQELLVRLQEIASHPAITLTVDPSSPQRRVSSPPSEPPPLFCATLPRELDDGWRVASFTSLSRGGGEPHEREDEPESPPEESPPAGAAHPFATLPAGRATGTLIHTILQRLDFSDPDPKRRSALVRETVAGTALEGQATVVCAMLEELLATPIMKGFTLSRLTPGRWCSELAFRFPIPSIDSRTLARIVAGYPLPFDPDSLARRLDFTLRGGVMTGSIDMLFVWEGLHYLVDWKTNRLGSALDDYRPERIAREMEENLYPLQYLIYTAALHRHLKVRLPAYDYDTHVGGVFYLFLRGIDRRRTDCGIFRDRPPRELVERLDRELFGGGGR